MFRVCTSKHFYETASNLVNFFSFLIKAEQGVWWETLNTLSFITTWSLSAFRPIFLTLEILTSSNHTEVNRNFPLKHRSQKSEHFLEIFDNPGFHWGNPRPVTRWSARSTVFIVLLNWIGFYLTRLRAQKLSENNFSAVVKWRSPLFTLVRLDKLVTIMICIDMWNKLKTECFRFANSQRFLPYSKGVTITYVLFLWCLAQEHKGARSPLGACAWLVSV